MAKAKARKAKKLNSSNKRNLFIVAVILICLGLVIFVMDHNVPNVPEYASSEVFETNDASSPLGPSQGCKLVATDYVCDIKINNPTAEPLEWSAAIENLEGASIVDDAGGTVAPNESAVIQLSVPQAFCTANPEGEGTVTILDSTESSNQDKTIFACQPETEVTEPPTSGN